VTSHLDQIDLRIKPISELRPHEETVERLSEKLARALVKEGVQRDPVVVDRASGTILDGTHRVEALRRTGAVVVLAYVLDYRDPRVSLYRWCRLVRKPDERLASRVIKGLGLERRDRAHLGAAAIEGSQSLQVLFQGETFGRGEPSLGGDIETMRAFDRAAEANGLKVEFIDESRVTGGPLGGSDLFLFPPRFGKDDVLRAGAEGRLFPPKSTLHVFPVRPLGVRYPVEYLREGRDVLGAVLATRTPRLVDPSAYQGGRSYREKVVVFE
jgi:hypothetical protein